LLGKVQVRLDEADRFCRPEAAEVHGGEQTHEVTTTGTPVTAYVGNRRQEIPRLLRVGDNPRVDLVGHLWLLPADSRDGILSQLPQVDGVIRGVDERPTLTPHGFAAAAVPSSLSFSESRTARAVAGSARSASGRDALDTQWRTFRTSSGTSRS
jgi:hypothetical protein